MNIILLISDTRLHEQEADAHKLMVRFSRWCTAGAGAFEMRQIRSNEDGAFANDMLVFV